MKEKTVAGSIETAYEKKLPTALQYSTVAREFETAEEVRSAGEWPNDKSIVSMVNQREVAKARASAIKSTLDAAGIKPPTLEDADEAVKNIAKTLLAQKKADDEASALTMARAILGL